MLLTHLSSLGLNLSQTITNDALRAHITKQFFSGPTKAIITECTPPGITGINQILWEFILGNNNTSSIENALAENPTFENFDDKTWKLLRLACSTSTETHTLICQKIQLLLSPDDDNLSSAAIESKSPPMPAEVFLGKWPDFSRINYHETWLELFSSAADALRVLPTEHSDYQNYQDEFNSLLSQVLWNFITDSSDSIFIDRILAAIHSFKNLAGQTLPLLYLASLSSEAISALYLETVTAKINTSSAALRDMSTRKKEKNNTQDSATLSAKQKLQDHNDTMLDFLKNRPSHYNITDFHEAWISLLSSTLKTQKHSKLFNQGFNRALWIAITSKEPTKKLTAGIIAIISFALDFFDEKTWALLHIFCANLDNSTKGPIFNSIFKKAISSENTSNETAVQARLFLMSQPDYINFNNGKNKKSLMTLMVTSNDPHTMYALLTQPEFHSIIGDSLENFSDKFIKAINTLEKYYYHHEQREASSLTVFIKSSGIKNDAERKNTLWKNIAALQINTSNLQELPVGVESLVACGIDAEANQLDIEEEQIFLTKLALLSFAQWRLYTDKQTIQLDKLISKIEEISISPEGHQEEKIEAKKQKLETKLAQKKFTLAQENSEHLMQRLLALMEISGMLNRIITLAQTTTISTTALEAKDTDVIIDLEKSDNKQAVHYINVMTHNFNQASQYYIVDFIRGIFLKLLWGNRAEGYSNSRESKYNSTAIDWLFNLDFCRNLVFFTRNDTQKDTLEAIWIANDTYILDKISAYNHNNPSRPLFNLATTQPQYTAAETYPQATRHNHGMLQGIKRLLQDPDFSLVKYYEASSEAFKQLDLPQIQLFKQFLPSKKSDKSPGNRNSSTITDEKTRNGGDFVAELIALVTRNNDDIDFLNHLDQNKRVNNIHETKMEVYHNQKTFFRLILALNPNSQKTFYQNTLFTRFRLQYRAVKYERELESTPYSNERKQKKEIKKTCIEWIEKRFDDIVSGHLDDPNKEPPMLTLYNNLNRGKPRQFYKENEANKIASNWAREALLSNSPFIKALYQSPVTLFSGGVGSETAQMFAVWPTILFDRLFKGTNITHQEVWEKAYPSLDYTQDVTTVYKKQIALDTQSAASTPTPANRPGATRRLLSPERKPASEDSTNRHSFLASREPMAFAIDTTTSKSDQKPKAHL